MTGLPYDGMLENTPTDPSNAQHYAELLSLWKDQHRVFVGGERQSPEEFWAWDKRVQSLLKHAERVFFLEPHIKNADPNDVTIAEVNRINHLTKILIHRQGIKTQNGFNG